MNVFYKLGFTILLPSIVVAYLLIAIDIVLGLNSPLRYAVFTSGFVALIGLGFLVAGVIRDIWE